MGTIQFTTNFFTTLECYIIYLSNMDWLHEASPYHSL